MIHSAWLSTLALLTLTLPVVKGQRNTCSPNDDGFRGAKCIRGQGTAYASAFCSSFLPITTPVEISTNTVTATTTRNITSYTATETETASPPATTTSSETATFSSTTTVTTFDTVITGTITSFVDTTTTTAISFSNVLTCPGDPTTSSSSVSSSSSSSRSSSSTLSFSTSSKNVTTGAGAPTGTGTGSGVSRTGVSSSFPHSGSLSYYTSSRPSYSVPPYYTSPDPTTSSSSLPPFITLPYGGHGKEKRQVFGQPRCLRRLDRTSGLAGISDACNCLAIAKPTPIQSVTTVTDPDTTITQTNEIFTASTSTTTPTVTVTQPVNRTSIITDLVTSTTSIATTISTTLTRTRTSVSTITGPSPTPSTFNIYYTLNTTSTTSPARFFQADPAPGGSGIVIANENEADFFSLDGTGRLVDVSAGGLFVTKNTQDLYPYSLLQTTTEAGNTAVCTACGGRLQCDFPGTTGNTFAICHGVLALGPRGVFGQDADEDGIVDCVAVDLRFK